MSEQYFHVVMVGGRWLEEPPPYPEGPHFTLRGLPELAIVVNNPTPAEKHATRAGDFEFAVSVIDGIIFLCYRCDPVFGWSDASFNIHRVEPEERERWLKRTLEPDTHLVMHLLLVEATQGTIIAMRAFTLPPNIVQALFKAIHEQANQPYDEQKYNAMIAALYARYTSKDIAAEAIARGKGGT